MCRIFVFSFSIKYQWNYWYLILWIEHTVFYSDFLCELVYVLFLDTPILPNHFFFKNFTIEYVFRTIYYLVDKHREGAYSIQNSLNRWSIRFWSGSIFNSLISFTIKTNCKNEFVFIDNINYWFWVIFRYGSTSTCSI